jgi:hypothetical protein
LSSAIPVPGRVGDGDPAGAVDVHHPGRAEHRLRVEAQGIEPGVVDAAIEHVDWLVAAGGAHRDAPILDPQVRSLDQLRPHLVGEEGVLEICRVVDARGQHRDHRLVARRRGRAPGGEAAGEPARIVRDLAHPHMGEQFREHRHHRLAVLEHVRDPRWRAGVVLEHQELVLAGADEVDPDDVAVDPAGRGEAHHLREERRVAAQQAVRQATATDDLLAMVEIVQEGVDRPHPLLDTALQPPPLGAGDDPRNHVERDQPFLGVVLAVDVEGDAGAAEGALGLAALAPQQRCVLLLVPVAVALIRRTRCARVVVHLVV